MSYQTNTSTLLLKVGVTAALASDDSSDGDESDDDAVLGPSAPRISFIFDLEYCNFCTICMMHMKQCKQAAVQRIQEVESTARARERPGELLLVRASCSACKRSEART